MEKKESSISKPKVPESWEPAYIVECYDGLGFTISIDQFLSLSQAVKAGEAPDHITLDDSIISMKSIKSVTPRWPNHRPPRPQPSYHTKEVLLDGKVSYAKVIGNQDMIDLWVKLFGGEKNLLLQEGATV